MGFSRQENWSRLPFPSPEDFPNPGIKPQYPELEADSLPSEPPVKPPIYIYIYIYLIYGKAMVFPVVMYGCERWTVKKAEHRKIGAFELWCWRRLLRVPWTARRSSLSILKDINPGCSLEGLMLKLKLQYFGHLMRRADSLEKTLMLGGTGGRRRRGQQRMRWLDGHWLDGHEFE